MNQTKTLIFAAVILGMFLMPSILTVAYAQYMGNVGQSGETGAKTLEETLELAKRRVEAAEANPSSGSGTPYLSADGVLGASAISAAVFGGVAAAFFFRSRSGKYTAPGRG